MAGGNDLELSTASGCRELCSYSSLKVVLYLPYRPTYSLRKGRRSSLTRMVGTGGMMKEEGSIRNAKPKGCKLIHWVSVYGPCFMLLAVFPSYTTPPHDYPMKRKASHHAGPYIPTASPIVFSRYYFPSFRIRHLSRWSKRREIRSTCSSSPLWHWGPSRLAMQTPLSAPLWHNLPSCESAVTRAEQHIDLAVDLID